MPRTQTPTEPRRVRDYVLWAERRFTQSRLHFGHGTANARDEAAWLVASTLVIPHERLDAEAARLVTATEDASLRARVEERIRTRKPLAYLLHEAWFAGRKFFVDERVLVPRSLIGDFLPDRFQTWIGDAPVAHILDLCTGSGCIAVAAAFTFPAARVDASDLSADALAVARINVDRFQLDGRIELLRSDLFAGLAGRRYDLILTNPPYVDARDMATLPREYRHEPTLALAAGESGLDVVLRILAEAPGHLTDHGVLVAEVGNSAATLAAQFPAVPFHWLTAVSGDESVFVLTRAELLRHGDSFRTALQMPR